MTVQTIATLRTNMPIGVTGGITAQDMQDFIDTVEDRTIQQTLAKTANYSAVSGDNRRLISFNSATPVTLTLPNSLPAGWECWVIQEGAGIVAFTVTGGTLFHGNNHSVTSGPGALARLVVKSNAGTSPQVYLTGSTAVRNYYVSNSGSDSNSGLSDAVPWLTVAKVNGTSFQKGSVINFLRDGEWREQLTIPSSNITIDAYGVGLKPIINAANLKTTWTSEVVGAFTAYWTAQTGNPGPQVFINKCRLTSVGAKASLTATNTFWYDSTNNRVYVRLVREANPTTKVMEIGVRSRCVQASDLTDIHIRNLRVFGTILAGDGSDGYGVEFGQNTTYSSMEYIDCDNHDGHGLQIADWSDGSITSDLTGCSIIGCVVRKCTSTGIMLGNRTHECLVKDCIAEYNCSRGEDFTAGLRYVSDFVAGATEVPQNRARDMIFDNVISRYNTSFLNGEAGIHMDTPGPNCIIRNCTVYRNGKIGIMWEWGGANGGEIYNNLVFSNPETGILSYRRTQNLVIHHNTVWGNYQNISLSGEFGGETNLYGGYRNNTVRDNISTGFTSGGMNLYMGWGGENAGNGSGNQAYNNCFGVAATNFIVFGDGVNKSTYAAFETAYGATSLSVQADPLLSGAPNTFALQPTSPCVGAGSDGCTIGANIILNKII